MTKNISVKREKQTRYLSQAIQLEEAVNPHIIRATMSMVSLAILAFIGWAGITNINEVARTPGEVVPRGFQQTVQHLEGGIIQAINIREGEIVKPGQILLQIEDESARAELARAISKQMTLEMQEERLRAYTENRAPDFSAFKDMPEDIANDQDSFFEGMKNARQKEEQVINEQIAQKKQAIKSLQADLSTAQSSLRIAEDIYRKRKNLNQKGYSSDMALLDSEARLTEISGDAKRLNSQILTAKNEIKEYESRLVSVRANHKDNAFEKLDAVSSESAQNKEIIEKLQERISRLSVKAPAHGLVKGLSVNTVGAVVQPGQTLMEIVPMDAALEVQVKISPKDIGHLKIGQNVQVKFSTFDFSRYGSAHGKIDQISATTFNGENGERYYRGRVILDKNYVGHDQRNVIMPGMTVMADIITGEKTILQYLLKPIHLSLKTAFSER